MAEEQLKEDHLSQMIFTTLSAIGFDREWLLQKSEAQKEIFKLADRLNETFNFPIKIELVGSTAEGVSLSSSDMDCMIIITDTICVDTANISNGFNIVEAEYINTPPGYVKLVLAYGDEDSALFECLHQSDLYKAYFGRVYISSPIFRNFFLQSMQAINKVRDGYVCFETQGPAITIERIDHVLAMYFYGGCYLSNWSKRVRYYHWPSVSLIQEITSMEGYVVPVGHKSSDSQNIEWRVCYTIAELKLIKSLTDVQLKFYILFKYVAKEIKKNVCEDISSYIVKNIVFWIVETEPEQAFVPSNLVKLLKKAIMFIKYSLQNNHLPNYMIPERNLIRENMNGKEKHRIIAGLVEYENFALHKLPRLNECINFFNQMLESHQIDFYREWRRKVENCFLASALCKIDHFKLEMLFKRTRMMDIEWEFFKDKRFWPIMITLFDLTVPDWINLILSGQLEYMLQLLYSRLREMPYL
ncbi:uncharacterized protein LOC132749284 [Ruditapes philippinarum]|uniref:uncharacterized protein LOC132749284 n=1 Tax=Ruditapes philippinarum TaxID=129788 RepID=UPI00295B4151|nr:uncharacterized protein LOC132749284 [Ruditapes philippinarum]